MHLSPLAADVHTFLRSRGAQQDAPGRIGSMWRLKDVSIGVTDELEPDSLEWASVAQRIALALNISSQSVEQAIRSQFVDVAFLRAAKDVVIEGSIPLDAGVRLVTSARSMLRSSATTAQRVRSHIAGSYSVTGDRIAKEARLGHTVRGSYIVPLIMPIPRAEPDSSTTPAFDTMAGEKAAFEPAQRRVMRTFAESLEAVEQAIVRPAKQPQAKDVNEIVAAGVSLEFVNSLNEIVSSESVSDFTASFDWASSVAAPKSLTDSVLIPHDASELLTMASRLLKTAKAQSQQVITGPIVQVRHIPGDPFGDASVQTIRNGRPAEVHVRLREHTVGEALEWMRASRTVLVEGRISRQPGSPLWIEEAQRFLPLDHTYLH